MRLIAARNLKQISRLLKLVTLFFVLLFSYSNCISSNVLPKGITVSTQEYNGVPYDGAKESYYRFIPGYSCSGAPSPVQVSNLNSDGTTATLLTNNGTSCGTNSTTIPVSQINFSPFETDFVSINDALFEQFSQAPAGIPANLAEIQCRDNFANPTVELVAHFNNQTNAAVARIYSASGNITDFPVSRLLTFGSVSYVSNQVSFSVDMSQISGSVRKYTATVTGSTVSHLSTNQKLTCVIGGSLDTSNWSFKQVGYGSGTSYIAMNNGQIFTTNGISLIPGYPGITHLLAQDSSGAFYDYTAKYFGQNADVQSIYTFANNHNAFVFVSSSNTESLYSAYMYNSLTSQYTRLTNLNTNPALGNMQPTSEMMYPLMNPTFLANGHLVFDVTIDHNFVSSGQHLVRDFNPATNQSFDVTPNVADYQFLPLSNKLFLLTQVPVAGSYSFSIYDSTSQTTKPYTLAMPGCTADLNVAPAVNNETTMLIAATCNAGAEKNLFMISLSTMSIKLVAKNKGLAWASPNPNWVLLGNYVLTTSPYVAQPFFTLSTQTMTAYNLTTGQSWPVAMDAYFNQNDGPSSPVPVTSFSTDILGPKLALANNRYLYGMTGSYQAPTLNQVDLTTGKTTSICSAVPGFKFYVGSRGSYDAVPSAYLFTYDFQAQVYSIYKLMDDGSCALTNSFPSIYPSLMELSPNSIGFGLALNLGNDDYTHQAVLVPVNGQPPLQLSNNSGNGWGIAAVSDDGTKVFVGGPDANEDIHIYEFQVNPAQ